MVGNGGNTGVTVGQKGVAGCEMIGDLVYGRGEQMENFEQEQDDALSSQKFILRYLLLTQV